MSAEQPYPGRILVVIPVYGEGRGLYSVIQSVINLGYEVVVIDDGCPEPIQDQLQGLPVHRLRHQVNLGQGAALQTAFDYACRLNADMVITFDADGQHLAADIASLITPVATGEADIVLGSRFLPDRPSGIPFSRKLVLQLARLINFFLSGYWLSDAHNGLRALNRKALNHIRLTENRMAHASELLFEIRQFRLRFVEVPVHIQYPDEARKKGQSAWQGIRILFDLVLHKLFE